MGGPYSFFLSLATAAGSTAFCCLLALWALRFGFKKPRRKDCRRECVLPEKERMSVVGRVEAAERQVGSSMMEQLVPEITTHTLSYLDYISLCRLSMTNSAMRRAANDDGVWKALYHKDFTIEQGSVIPVNGWKSYYAATKAIVSVNAEFYEIIREQSLQAMSQLWLQADYVKCIHGSGELFSGYDAVIESWGLGFNWVVQGGGEGVDFEIRDVRARVLTDMAWVTMKAYVDVDSGPFHVTNIYELHNGRWFMVHHHSSVIMLGDGEQQVHHNINIFG